MIKIIKEDYRKYFFIIIIGGLAILSFLLLKSFFTAISIGIIMTYLFYPIYKLLIKRINNKNISALITTIVILLLFFVPMFFVIDLLSKEAYSIYFSVKQKISEEDLFKECVDQKGLICNFSNYINNLLENPKFKTQIEDIIKSFTSYIIRGVSSILISIPKIVLNFFISVCLIFFLLRDGELLLNRIKDLLPIKKSHQEDVIKRVNEVANGVIFGQILFAVIHGIIGGFMFYIFRLSSPILWGSIITLFALLPMIGPLTILIPAGIFLVIKGYSIANNWLIIEGILVIVISVIIVNIIEHVIKPKVISGKAKVHPLVILLGVFGGLELFGFIGMFIGPLLLALFLLFVRIYEDETNEAKG